MADAFKAFFDELDRKMHVDSFKGNRFNILFHNEAGVYFHSNDIIDFLETSCTHPNLSLLELQKLLTNKVHLAELRALGIIDELITGPYFKLNNQEGSILEMGPLRLCW